MDLHIAPAGELIRYLAAFSRFFRLTQEVCASRDESGILMIGNAANALHNIPDHMRMRANERRDFWYPYDGQWAAHFRNRGAPETALNLWNEIFTANNDHLELGIEDDFANWGLPPLAHFDGWMTFFAEACLDIRYLRNFAASPASLWTINPANLTDLEREIVFSGAWAQTLSPLPAALVNWMSFDPSILQENRRALEDRGLGLWAAAVFTRIDELR